MPVLVTCQCGKQYRVKDEYAGLRAKCPVCGTVVRIPDDRQQPAAEPAEPPPTKPAVTDGVSALLSGGFVPPPPVSISKPGSRARKLILAGSGATLVLAVLVVCYFYFGGSAPTSTQRREPGLPQAALGSANGQAPVRDSTHPPPASATEWISADFKQTSPTDLQSISAVLAHIGKMGFLPRKGLSIKMFASDGTPTGRVEMYENEESSATLLVMRPQLGSDYVVIASEPRDRAALLDLAARISPELRKACDDCLAEFERTGKVCKKDVGKMGVSVNQEGAIGISPEP